MVSVSWGQLEVWRSFWMFLDVYAVDAVDCNHENPLRTLWKIQKMNRKHISNHSQICHVSLSWKTLQKIEFPPNTNMCLVSNVVHFIIIYQSYNQMFNDSPICTLCLWQLAKSKSDRRRFRKNLRYHVQREPVSNSMRKCKSLGTNKHRKRLLIKDAQKKATGVIWFTKNLSQVLRIFYKKKPTEIYNYNLPGQNTGKFTQSHGAEQCLNKHDEYINIHNLSRACGPQRCL